MIDPLKYLFHFNRPVENSVLCEVLVCKSLNPALKEFYFTEKRRELFLAILGQWGAKREIDIEILRGNHQDIIETVLNSSGTCSDTAIEELKKAWYVRRRGEILMESETMSDSAMALKHIQKISGETFLNDTFKEYDHVGTIDKMVEAINNSGNTNKEILGASVGISELDLIINGIEKSMFYVLGALKKTGKSRMMVQFACKLEEAGLGILINSLEMNPVQLNTCALSYLSEINSYSIGHKLSPENQKKIAIKMEKMYKLKFDFCREYSVMDLWQRIEYLKNKKSIDVVFIDFLQRMREDKYKSDRVREVESISMQLANMSRELNIAVIALCQLSGAAERVDSEDVPDMSYLKESQGIAENADCIMILHNPTRHESPFTIDGSYVIQNFKMKVEQRYGISGKNIELEGDLRICKFWNKGDMRKL